MKLATSKNERGSVLITAFLTITILTLICATSLYVTSQNQSSGMQTASWQQALCGAEGGVDMAVQALNNNSWNGWYSYSYGTNTLPNGKPPYAFTSPSPTTTPSSPWPAAAGLPNTTAYNFRFLGSSDMKTTPEYTMSGVSGYTNSPEGNNKIWGWVTIDTGALPNNNGQWYRVRATGVALTNGLFRASSNRLDNDLRNSIGLRFDRKTGSSLATNNYGQTTRTIEAIMKPPGQSLFPRAVTLQSELKMSGGGVIDSFDSGNSFASNNGQYDVTKLHVAPNYYGNNGDIGIVDVGSTDVGSTTVWGDITYSGTPPPKNTNNVKGNVNHPFDGSSVTPVSSPSWNNGTYNSYSGGSPPFTTTSGTNKALIKINGDLNVPGGQSINLVPSNSSSSPITEYTIWVTGKFTTSGSGTINQDPHVKVTWYVGDDINISGSSYQNQGGVASSVIVYGYGSNNKATISGSGSFIGTLDAPNYDVGLSGSGGLVGALIGKSLSISGGAGVHYDEALSRLGVSGASGKYAFASWFEDNSDPGRKDVNLNPIIY